MLSILQVSKHINAHTGGEFLNCNTCNWVSWSASVEDTLDICCLGCHIHATPSCSPPNHNRKPVTYENWLENDLLVHAYIRSTCTKLEWDHIKNCTSAQECWLMLEEVHTNEGPIQQAQLIQGVVGKKILCSLDMLETACKQAEDIACAFNMAEGLTKDTFNCIILLMNLGTGLDHLCSQIQCDIQDATKSNPVTPQRILNYLESECDILVRNGNTSSTSVALAAINVSCPLGHSKSKCDNCGKPYHVQRYCIKTGSGMVGKTLAQA